MKIDIGFNARGFLANNFLYKNVREHSIVIIEDMVIIKFYHTRKGIERHLEFQIPKDNLSGLAIRRYS